MNPAERSLELSHLLEGTRITLLSLTENGQTVTLRREGVATAPVATPEAALVVAAPCAGIFLRAHPLRAEFLAETGRFVAAGAVLGLLKIGPLLVAVHAPVSGTLAAVDSTDAALVGFGTSLFRLSPGGEPS